MTTKDRPSYIAHWSEIEGTDENHYKGDDELLAINAAFGRHFGLGRIGIHHQRWLVLTKQLETFGQAAA